MQHLRIGTAKHAAEVILFAVTFLGTLLSAGASLGEVATDGSMGPQQILAGPDFDISADLGRIRGANLFHSFSEFDLSAGQRATFSGPAHIENIIGRVTGGTPSMIDGIIRSAISGADLFLLNPSGILFGPNAALDVTGSFYAGTADYLRFSDSSRFPSTPASFEVLSTARPEAFGFLTTRPGDISVNGSHLAVPAGETLFLTAGNLSIQSNGNLEAPGGTIVLTGVGAAGEIRPETPEILQPLDDSSGVIDISNSNISVDGDTPGQVVIRGGRIEIVDAQVTAENKGTGNAAAPAIDVAAASEITIKDNGKLESVALGRGRGGDIRVTSENLKIENNGLIQTRAEGAGQGGDIYVDVADGIFIDGSDLPVEDYTTGIFSEAMGAADAGDVSVLSVMLTLIKGGQLVSLSSGRGDSGSIKLTTDKINMDRGEIFTTARGEEASNAGDIFIKADDVVLSDRSRIYTSVEETTSGSVGNVNIHLDNELILMNGSSISSYLDPVGTAGNIDIIARTIRLENDSTVRSRPLNDGKGGDIAIKVEKLDLRNNSSITSINAGDDSGGIIIVNCNGNIYLDHSWISTEVSKNTIGGIGGDIFIHSHNIELYNEASIVSTNEGIGGGGAINVDCSGDLRIDSGWISTNANGAIGGDIVIQAKNLDISNDSFISSYNKGRGSGGTIEMSCDGHVNLDNGYIGTGAREFGNGGNIHIKADSINLQNDALIETKSASAGDGGNIELESSHLIRIRESRIEADAKGGMDTNGGNIAMHAPHVLLHESQIKANAYGGRGGNILIDTGMYIADYLSILDASSALGLDGNVNIQAPLSDLSGTLKILEMEFLNLFDLIRQTCEARVQKGDYSSFVVKSRDALPVVPGTLQMSPLSNL